MPSPGSGKGKIVNKGGYVRITRRGPYHLWYEHRAVMHKLMQDFSYYGREIPDDFHVHHMDWNKQHNCPCNLLLIQDALHDGHSSAMRRCPYTGRLLSRREAEQMYSRGVPDWVMEES